jgi:hypothetical protein
MQGYLESMKAVLEQHKELFTKNKTLAQLSEVLESIDDRLTDQESGEEEQVDSDEDDYVIKHGLKRAQAEIKTHRKTKVAKKAGTVAVEEPSDTFQTSITRFLKRFFGTCLLSYDFMAMHELFYFVDPNTLIPKVFLFDLGLSC